MKRTSWSGKTLRTLLLVTGLVLVPGVSAIMVKTDHAAFQYLTRQNFAALKHFVTHHFITPWFPAFIAGVFLLETLKPADKRGGILSRGFVYDASIGFIIIAFQFIVVNFAMRVLYAVYAMCHLPVVGVALPRMSNWVLAVLGMARPHPGFTEVSSRSPRIGCRILRFQLRFGPFDMGWNVWHVQTRQGKPDQHRR